MTDYLTVDEVADRFKIDTETVRKWLKDGELIGVNIGTNWHIKPDDIRHFLDDKRLKNLEERAKKNRPEISWTRNRCCSCKTEMLSPLEKNNWACSPECKRKYDAQLAQVEILSDEDSIIMQANIPPPY